MTGILRAISAAKADPLTARMKAAPEIMEMARLLIWENPPQQTILRSENGSPWLPEGYSVDFPPVLLCSNAKRAANDQRPSCSRRTRPGGSRRISKDEARRIASNIAKLPELFRKKIRPPAPFVSCANRSDLSRRGRKQTEEAQQEEGSHSKLPFPRIQHCPRIRGR